MMFDDCIILAGGGGTRLWPASTRCLPKQFLSEPITADGEPRSFLVSSIERALAVTGESGRVIIISGKEHISAIVKAVAAFGSEQKKRMTLIPEPETKNTAAAIVCGSFFVGEGRTVLTLTSDHIIRPIETFARTAGFAAAFARQDNLVVFGIPPRGPETGYGYIQADTAAGNLAAQNHEESSGGEDLPLVYRAASFREKPDKVAAEAFLAAGNFYWNSGMFAFSSSFIMEQFRRNAPDVLAAFENLSSPSDSAFTFEEGLRILSSWEGLSQSYGKAPAISFDYALAEKCDKTVMVAADFDWHDVGNWDEYARFSEKHGFAGAEVFAANANNCYVNADIPVALCGVEDLVVVIRSGKDGHPPSALVMRRGESQRVREIVEQIKNSGKTELL